MNTTINVECIDQNLIITNSPTIASGGICENLVSFKFCSKWDNFSKTAVFYQNEKNVYYALIDSQNMCIVPHEATLKEGTLYLGVFGVNGEVRRTSEIGRIRIHKGAWSKDLHPSDPTPDIYTQILAQYNEILDKQESFINSQEQTMSDYQEAWLETVETTRKEMVNEVNILVEQAKLGDAKTLNGHNDEYFLPRTDGIISGGLITKALKLTNGVHSFILSNYTDTDVLDGWKYSTAIVLKRNSSSIVIALFDERSASIAINSYNGIDWMGWGVGVTKADLVNYLSIKGGTITGILNVGSDTDTDTKMFNIQNAKKRVALEMNPHGVFYMYDYTNGKAIIESSADGTSVFNGVASACLPLSGGLATNINIGNLDTLGMSGFRMKDINGTIVGYLGMSSDNELYKWNGIATAKTKFLNTGNSNAVKISSTAPSDTTALWVVTE